jgi:hypothetical protein
MSDEAHSLRTIDWRSVFPFTQLFRAFRIAIHPAKMVLALIAILLVYGVGRAMDGLWLDRHLAVPGEIAIYEGASNRVEFADSVAGARKVLESRRTALARELSAQAKVYDANRAPLPDNASFRDMKRLVDEQREREAKAARDRYSAASEKNADAAKARDAQIATAYRSAGESLRLAREVEPLGLCLTFVDYEAKQVDAAASAIVRWDWTSGDGAITSLARFIFTGPGWALSKHPLFFILFTGVALLVWSIIGGAIARIAAVHVSQDEKISVRQALRFSTNKLMSFFAAPVMPVILIGLIGLILATAGWLSEFSYLGGLLTVIVGVLFAVLICIGVLMACALVGWVCGFGLMYPTIAVEGSDAFDAVSRSFSYVFARPWKVFVYTVIALVYGAVTYLFLRFMIFLTLTVLHECLTFWTHSTGPDGRTSIANAWTGPLWTTRSLPDSAPLDLAHGAADPYSLTFAESVGSSFLVFWVWLFATLLGAYLLSFFVSVNTIMYYLLRHDVDATDIDDVYLEPGEDEFEDALPEPAAGTVPHTPSANVPVSAMTERVVAERPSELPATPPVTTVTPPADEPTPPPAGS